MKIEFIGSEKESSFINAPQPAKQSLPDWYKNIPRFLGSGLPTIQDGKTVNNSLKSCVPFYDAMSSGYVQTTWCDINIEINSQDNSFKYQYSNGPQIISHRDSPSISEDFFYPIEFLWKAYWIPKMPKGWSVMFSHPMNRIDLPFYSLSAVVDADEFHHSIPGNYPFYVKKGFSGIIPAGTPIYQITPIKRENWKSEKIIVSEQEEIKMSSKIESHFFNGYRRFFHKKKHFK